MRFVHTGAAHRRRREPVTHLSLLSNGLSIKSPILGSEVIPSILESMFRPKSEVLSFKF